MKKNKNKNKMGEMLVIYSVAYSIDGKLEEVYFSMKNDAMRFYYDIVDENKRNKDFDYITVKEEKMLAHKIGNKGMMR